MFSTRTAIRHIHVYSTLTPIRYTRSFYPLYPPQLGTCLDTSESSQLQLRCSPDLLLLPSDLAPFAKVGTLCGWVGMFWSREGKAKHAGC